MNDEYYMKMALGLAEKGLGRTNPNPVVGAVLVKNGRVISTGYHKGAGLAHAEIEALDRAGRKAKGATLYVNLEPCSHFGRTPPCVDRIIKEGIKRVVIGMRDPNPLVNGKGIAELKRHGIEVKDGVLEKEARNINRIFASYVTKKRPFVTIKVAQSMDGKIATYTGDSKWVTNEESRKFVHKLRSEADAVLVGVNTVIKDDPLLTARAFKAKRQPLRIVLDSALKIPMKSRIIKTGPGRVVIATTQKAPGRKKEALEKKGVIVLPLKEDRGKVDLQALLLSLAKRGVSHLLVEGGGNVAAGFVERNLADEILFFISPKIIGGKDAVTSIEGRGIERVAQAVRLNDVNVERFGEDILVRGYLGEAPCSQVSLKR